MSSDNKKETDLKQAKNYFLNGLEFFSKEMFRQAEYSFRQSLKIIPDRESTLSNLSATLLKQKKYTESLEICQIILEKNNLNVEALVNLGDVLVGLKQYEQAIISFDKAISIKPDFAEAWSNRGNVLLELKKNEQALKSHNNAITIKPDYAEAWTFRGNALLELELYKEALESYSQSIILKPDFALAWVGRGNLFSRKEQYEQALASYDEAIRLKTNQAEAWSNRGNVLAELKQYAKALNSFDKAANIEPNFADAYWNKSLVQLLATDFENGWANYEYRWLRNDSDKKYYQEIPALISLNDVYSKNVLVWWEQGYGDVIQFSRYVTLLAEKCAKLVFEVQQPLKDLLTQSFPEVIITTRDEGIIDIDIDLQIPIMSLPKLFSANLDNIPFTDKYLKIEPKPFCLGIEKLSINNSKINIGIACSGNEKFKGRNRSIALSLFEPLLDLTNLYLVQKDIKDSDMKFLIKHPEIRNLSEQIITFSDTASFIDQMDLIITIDTSLAHLAGGLGKPTFLLLTCVANWRWFIDRLDSPWYSSIKIFRQKNNGEWATVIKDVRSEVLRHINTNQALIQTKPINV
jgi:tetratricopeptide (TPR) repeat protein